jgi:hypothetical protein
MTTRTAFAILALPVSISGCSSGRTPPAAPWPTEQRPFQASSEASRYIVRGQLAGTIAIQQGHLQIVVTSGSILSLDPDSAIHLRAFIAAATDRGWARLSTSEPHSLGAFAAGERRELAESLTFTVPLPSTFDPEHQWLAFQFSRSDSSTAYVCLEHNLMGPDSLSFSRAEQQRRAYELAC